MGRLSPEKQPSRWLLISIIVLWLLVAGSFIVYWGAQIFTVGESGQAEAHVIVPSPQQTGSVGLDQRTSLLTFQPAPTPRLILPWLRRPTTTSTATSTPQPPPTNTPTPTPVTPEPPFPTPMVDLVDRSIYMQALKPAFAADIDAVPEAPHYFIQAMLLPDVIPLVTGVERVRYINQAPVPLEEVYFRLYPNLPAYEGSTTVNRAIVDNQLVTPTLELEGSALLIPLARPLQPGEVTDITLWFYSSLPTSVKAGSAGTGLYGYYQGVYDLAGFYPTLAVYDDGGWNLEVTATFGDSTFTETAFYHVQLDVPSDHEVVASGTTLSHTNSGDGRYMHTIVAGPVRAFYAAVSPLYHFISEEVGGTTVNSYYLDGGLNGAQTALTYATGALEQFNRMFGEYPYRELDVLAMPTTGFGMEYAGVIAIANRFYGEAGGAYAEAVVHEVAHQWWYNLVGNDQPDIPWLDESLANYSYYLYFEAIGWTEMRDSIMNNDFLYRYQAAQNLGIDRPVGGPVIEFDPSNYINIVYSKGPLFFHNVRLRIGDEAFFAALFDYAQRYRYGIVYPADLMATFRSHSEQPLDDLYDFWIGDDARNG